MAEVLMVDTTHAQEALDKYAEREGSCSGGDISRIDDYTADLVDLIADLLHLADELNTEHGYLGSGGPGAAHSALNHYQAEL
jgi:hypothetical protein